MSFRPTRHHPGNSGGPLLDSAGLLIGMNTAIVSPSGAYAASVSRCRWIPSAASSRQLLATGRVRRAGLGVRLVPDHILARYEQKGVAILSVNPRSGAYKAGLRGCRQRTRGEFEFGDILLEMDDSPVESVADVAAIMERHQAGDAVKVVLLRGKEKMTISVTLQNVD